MAYHSDYLQSPVLDDSYQDGGSWQVPTSEIMTRSISQSTANTTFTYASSQYSYNTDLSSVGSPVVERKMYTEGFPSSSDQPLPQDSGQLVANVGYHLHDNDVPQTPQDLQLYATSLQAFDYQIPDIVYATEQAIKNAHPAAANDYHNNYCSTELYFLTFDHVNYAQQELLSESAQGSDPPSTSTEKQTYPCLVPGCIQKAFSRSADLDRHYKQVHVEEDKKVKFICDYRKCSRHESPFYRQDHFRDHLRDFHKEDLLRRSKKEDKKWWEGRAPHAVFKGWWRCNRCLVRRVDVRVEGWTCPGCGNPCESERVRVREARGVMGA
ncbi:hypothetical protein QBC40DRAFT_317603 [Triangularia verruculosa]|uniref:C2H2-type domain-containing protein n=1 Tax=Triangularia verruculosa TaxID=2587418 RepID=A0AAN6X8Y2_9PEZI|nr:hypothetical protein QBC40DRAFT_317603 [Triangularia verruculosa]